MKKWYAVVLIIVGLLGFGYFSANKGLNRSDEIQIRELFKRAEESVETKDVGKAMSCVSKDYKGIVGRNHDGLRLLVMQAFRSEFPYDVQVEAPETSVTGDTAHAATKVTVSAVRGADRDKLVSTQMTFGLLKEPARRYFIFPVKEWKVVSFEGMERIPELVSEY